MNNKLEKAIQVFLGGGIVIFPTDTTFGIGCRLDKPESIDRLFKIRQRPRVKATPVLVASIEMALPYLYSPSKIVRRLMKKYWPGALTIVAPCQKKLVHSPVRGGGDTLGLRMPNHSELLNVISEVGVPILGPSANFHGQPTPFKVEDLNPELVKLVDYVIPGTCKVKQASTVIDCTTSPWKILRQGSVVVTE